jgi:hypothetical protein
MHDLNIILLVLDRDSSRFRMDPKTIQRRRYLFWELYAMDLFSVNSIISKACNLVAHRANRVFGLGDLRLYDSLTLTVSSLMTMRLQLMNSGILSLDVSHLVTNPFTSCSG